MRCAHTTFFRGKRIRITLRDGTVLVRRYWDHTNMDIIVQDDNGEREYIPRAKLKSAMIYREATERMLARNVR